ncbi:hypothetical protein [Maliponia aquimaris]|uniref:Chromosome partition protein Smc n=1 Tax=Maliponia aquimaris TaxID=1673631 RepID=A0A238JYP9_9RHOB|nr:hypothetical protein [Maliponia aquimaris]SMX35791.1 hypothetical protein MAA8898_00645 [Maliponia aquimaris]
MRVWMLFGIGAALALLILSTSGTRAETAAELERQVSQIRANLDDAKALMGERNVELFAVREFLRQARNDWINAWVINEAAIRRDQAEIEALRRMGVFNQNSRDLNDKMRALLAERARLERLDGQRIEECDPPCTTMADLLRAYNARRDREQALTRGIADLDDWRNQLFDELAALKPRLAASRKAETAALQAELERLRDSRRRQSGLLSDGETFLLPDLDGTGWPLVLTKQELIQEVMGTYFVTGTSTDVDSETFRSEIAAIARTLLAQSESLKRQARANLATLDADIAQLERRLGGNADGQRPVAADGTATNCPPRNPDPASRTHRIPADARDSYLSCAYFPGDDGPIQAQVRYEDGKETGIAAYFSLDGGHHLDNIHNTRGSRQAGADCRYHSASAIREYHLYGDDGTEVAAFCEPDGTLGRCDFITHDGQARNCRMPCTDQCADQRRAIGWPPMQ